eukprot:gene18012-biopygen880
MQALRDPEGGMHGLCGNAFGSRGMGHVDHAQNAGPALIKTGEERVMCVRKRDAHPQRASAPGKSAQARQPRPQLTPQPTDASIKAAFAATLPPRRQLSRQSRWGHRQHRPKVEAPPAEPAPAAPEDPRAAPARKLAGERPTFWTPHCTCSVPVPEHAPAQVTSSDPPAPCAELYGLGARLDFRG